ncbi:MAG: sugar-binding protein, partial [Gammaproteobacteria bacterium]|nr:sugar-binding protein [Gammaproteobacteria bacterium]
MGKPAARLGDLTESGGPIIQGSLTVLIGSQGGIACSTCPGGKTIGSPVNPTLGAKVLLGPEDLDFALLGPMPLVWQRQYSSYVNAEHGGDCGLLGYGWKLPHELSIELQPTQTLLHDAGGRVITFDEPLRAGQSLHSDSEGLLLLRGGGGGRSAEYYSGSAPANQAQELLPWHQQQRWSHVPAAAKADASYILAATQTGRTVWLFKAQPTGPCRLIGLIDAFGRSQQYHHDDHGRLQGITDGAGRRYALLYNRPSKAAAASAAAPTAAPPTKAFAGLNPDSGLRLLGVDCVYDPHDPAQAGVSAGYTGSSANPPTPLVRYHYSPLGDLIAVHARDGQRTRQFSYDSAHRMVAHRVRSGPQHSYLYEDDRPGARVVEHHNEEGLSYTFHYQDALPKDPKAASCTTVRDSLGRTTQYHHEGRGGLKRITRQVHPDGSEEHFQYDGAGRRIAATDPLSRTTHWRYDGQGNLLGVQGADGRSSQQRWGLPGAQTDGLLLQSTSASGIHTHYQYDPWGRLLQTTVVAGDLTTSTQLEYLPEPPHTAPASARAWVDQPIALIDPQGGRKTLTYTSTGQLTSYTDCSGHTTRWHHDAWGEVIEETDPLGQHTRHQRDAMGRLLHTSQADGTLVQYRWGHNDQVQAITLGALANAAPGAPVQTTTITYDHDLWGRVTAQTQAGASLHLRYDAAGRVIELINENHASTRFTYDSQDRLIQEVGFDGRSQTYRYDAAGQLIEKTDAQDYGMAAQSEGEGTVRSRYHYDRAGRLTHRITAKAAAASEGAATTTNTDLQIHQFSYSDSGELITTQGWELNAEATTVLITAWLQLTTEQIQTTLAQQQDAQALASSPLLQNLQAHRLQKSSRVDLQRDALGRTTGEVQTLFRPGTSEGGSAAPAIEFEHRIHHRLGPLGQREVSDLQGIGHLGWLSYGPGHVHGVLRNQTPLLALERDKLHREVGRTLHLLQNGTEQTQPSITQTRQMDPLGRLLHQRWQGLPGQTSGAPSSAAPLIGGLQQRRYTYDSLGQLVGIQTPTQANAFQYDARQRLTGQTQASAQGERQEHWRLDPAGNRLPAQAAAQHLGPKTAAGADWTAQVQQNLYRPRFNLLQPDQNPDSPASKNVERWRDNRIGWSQGQSQDQSIGDEETTHYRYDSWGNRTQALHSDGSTTQLHYDGLHQLRQVTQIDAQGQVQSHTTYRYDPFGRRVSKTHHKTGQQSQATHYGWDGDRLIHTEDAEHIHHTVYEPGSFVPLLQMQRNKAGQTNPVKALLGMGGNETSNNLEQDLPHHEREMLHQALKEVLQPGYRLSALLPREMRGQVQESIKVLKDAQAQTEEAHPLTIRHMLT